MAPKKAKAAPATECESPNKEPESKASGKTPRKRGAAKQAEDETPEPTAKRSRAQATAEKTKSKAADADEAKKQKKADAEAKKQKKADASGEKPKKPDKNSPLKRSLTPREELPTEKARILKVLSVNVAGLRAVLNGDKAETLKDLVQAEKPDVLCLNEHKLKPEDVEENEAKLKELLPAEYSVMHWNCSTAKKGYSGVAVIFREAPDKDCAAISTPAEVSVKPGMGSIGDKDPIIAEEGRILTVELPELYLVSTYVPNSGMTLERLNYRVDRQAEKCWDRGLTEYINFLQKDGKKPVLVIGDFNCCHRVEDIWNMYTRPDFPEELAQKPLADQYTGLSSLKKSAGLTMEERESFPRMLEEAGLVDTFRARHPDATGVFSYFSQRAVQNRPMNRGLRLDYALASSSMCTHLKPAATESQGAEDGDPPPLRVLDSYILDERNMVADHTAIGCTVLLPSA